jgi:fatty acid desaturase
VFFQWGVALHELTFGATLKGGVSLKEKKPFLKQFGKKGVHQIFKDYIFFPLIAVPFFLQVLIGNIVANLIRNLWTSTIIFYGHFPEEVETFSIEECKNESKGHWYYRQMLGSANFQGSELLHTITSNLSFQVEHHLFPDLPALSYAEVSPKVQKIAKELGIPYHT